MHLVTIPHEPARTPSRGMAGAALRCVSASSWRDTRSGPRPDRSARRAMRAGTIGWLGQDGWVLLSPPQE